MVHIPRLKQVRPEIWLLLILVFAAILRLCFYAGINYTQEQDEGIYLSDIQAKLKGCFLTDYHNLPRDYLANPAEIPRFRYLIIYSTLLFFRLFGVNDMSSVLFSLLCSLGSVALTYYLGRFFLSQNQALLASFLFAIFPLNILYSTRLMPDAPLAFFFWLSLFFFMKGEQCPEEALSGKSLYFWLSGLTVGLCYLIKLPFIIVFALFLVYMVMYRRLDRRYLFIVLGFLCVIIPEGIIYTLKGEPFFLNIKITAGAYKLKFTQETVLTEKIIPGVFHLIYNDSKPFYYSKAILHSMVSIYRNYYGYFWPFLIISAMYIIHRREKKLYIVIAWLCVLFLLHEFGPCRFSFNTGEALFNYCLVFKKERYFTNLIFPMVIPVAYFLSAIRSKPFSKFCILVLLGTSLVSTYFSLLYFRAGISALDEAYSFLKVMPGRKIYADYPAALHLQYKFGFKRDEEIINLSGQKIEQGYVVLGGSRGMDLAPRHIRKFTEEALKQRNSSWKLIKTIDNPAKEYRKNVEDLSIYYVE